MSCSKYFHLPCVLASGGFIDFQTKSSFCKDHLYQAPLVCEYVKRQTIFSFYILLLFIYLLLSIFIHFIYTPAF